MSGVISSVGGLTAYETSDVRSNNSSVSGTSSSLAEASGSIASYSPNPSLEVDPGLGLAILQFRDENGSVQYTLPSEQQIAVYRASMQTSAQSGSTSQAGTTEQAVSTPPAASAQNETS